ncbi:hypothetical protein IQ235_09410 [Oscillatoriales cyanobacterium LEGE 11467]|uniref:Uncharacterized protein n=1 Tax=Zarconia navalis LEGE 11467 TaxID=1828826 RepID=A0A928VZ66_9CYAN|nr:hypothetical protein [Zarconia navalis]MBE9040996.1 hypothetical protein [Zarconia navalis LEGE 11467]
MTAENKPPLIARIVTSKWVTFSLYLATVGASIYTGYELGLKDSQRVRFDCRVAEEGVVCELPTASVPHELTFDRIPLKTIGGSSDE